MPTSFGSASNFTAKFTGPYSNPVGTKIVDLVIYQKNWKEAVSPYSQEITVDGVSKNSVINLVADADTLEILSSSRSMVYLENDGGTVRAVAVGGKPKEDLEVQAIIQEGVVI